MTLSGMVSRMGIKRDSAGADETIFRWAGGYTGSEFLGEGGRRGGSLGEARKRVGGISEGPLSRLIFTDRISPGRG